MPNRAHVLELNFNMLYDRMAHAHEFVGWCAFGAAWDARRVMVLNHLDRDHGVIVDVGCGEGRLLRRLDALGLVSAGIEPSSRMAHRARSRGCLVVRGIAESLPLIDGRVDTIVCTYPGPWITQPQSHAELKRVLRPNGSLHVLLGGNYVRGRGALIRRAAARIVYGQHAQSMPDFVIQGFVGTCEVVADRWGEAIVWRGRRAMD